MSNLSKYAAKKKSGVRKYQTNRSKTPQKFVPESALVGKPEERIIYKDGEPYRTVKA